MSHEDMFRHIWRQRGFPEGTIDRLWKEKLAKEPVQLVQANGDALRAELVRGR